jgi:GABA(A) receptor-associated protein
LSVNDVIDFIDGQAVEGLQPEVVGKMIRGTPGTQVVFDIFGVHNMRRARIGITRWPVDRDDKRIARDSSDASEEQEHEVPKSRRRKPQRQAPLPPPPASQPELCDYDHSHNAIPTASSSAEQLPQAAASAPAFPTAPVAQVSGVMMCNRDNGVSRCGVGLGFEYQPARGVLVLRSLSVTGSPFALGDCLAEVNGTDVTSNAMLAPSLIFGDAGTPLHLKMTRGGDHANSVDATLIRNPSPEDANLMTMSGGAKTCGIGVVLELETNSRCFYVKRVVHGGPAFSAGVLQGDLVTQIDEADMRSFNKEQLPSLILGPEGTTLRMKLLRAGEVEQRELVITRFLDTAKAQQSNLASSAVLTFDYMESVGTPLQVERYSETLHSDIVNALLTVPKRISVVSLSLERGTANVYILPDFEGADTRSVEELVRDFVYQVSTKKSALRQTPTCASLSKIDVLGQVDPSQPKLELDTLFSAHMMLKASLLSTRCEPNEVVLPASPTSDDANTAAEPSPEGSLQPTPTTSDAVNENDISSPEENGLQPTLTASDAANSAAQSSPEESIRQPEHSVCAPKVLLIQRAPSHGHGKGTSHVERDSSEEVDASPVISAVDIRERETSKEMEESEPEHEVNAKVPDRLDDLEGDSEEGGYMAPGTEQVPEILPASTKQTELPICRKPSTCSGPDEGDTIDELSGDSPAPDEESPVSSDETTCANDSRQLSGSFSSSTGPAEPSADPVSELLVEPELPSPFEGLESVGEGSCEAVNVEAQTVAIEEETSVLAEPPSTVRSKSLKLLSLPAEVSTLAVESAQSTDVEAPPIAPIVVELAGVPVDVPAAGSALESIAALDSCGVQSVEEGKELGLSSEESPTEAFAKQDLKLDMTGLQAMGSDAWASGKYLYAQGATTSNVPCAPPRPSAVVAIQRACEGLHQEGITSAVSAVTAHKHGAKEMEEICEKFPHRIPVVVTKAEYSIAPDMLGSKYLVPMNITAKNLHILISKRIDELPDGMRLVLSVHNVPILANGNEIRQLYDAHKGLDGILYLRYDVEEGESHSDDAESAEPLEATAKGEELGGPSKSSSPIKMLSQGASVMELTSSFADTAQGRLKNWINLDGSVLKSAADDNEESISPLSLLIGFGSNLQQMAMPSDTNTKPQTSAPAPTPQARAEKREEGASRRPGTEPPPLQAGVGLKIERDVGGRGFRVAGVASDGPGECFIWLRPATCGVSSLALTLMCPCSCEYGRQGK